MKPCKPIYKHIDQDEFGDGRKITTSLLTRFCNNISKLREKTEELESNTDPELRKRFTPPIIHDLHSYGVKLNAYTGYEFDNSTETIFLDAIGLKTIEIPVNELTVETKDNNTLYTYKFEATHTIAKIAVNKETNVYNKQNTLEELNNATNGYYLDNKKLHIKLANSDTLENVLVIVNSDDPYIDLKNTTAQIDLAKNKIHAPYSKDQFEEEVIDQNTAEQYSYDKTTGQLSIATRNVEKYWNFGWRKFNHFWMYPLWLQDPFAENPNTPPIPTVARAFIITPRNSGILSKIRLMFRVKDGAEDEVYIEIRALTKEGKPSSKIIAREKTQIRGAKQSLLHTIKFNAAPMVEKGEKYAVVVRAGFTSPDKSYGIGGWSYITYPKEALANLGKKIQTTIGNIPFKWRHIFDFEDDIFSDVFWSIDNCITWNKVHPILEGVLDGMGARAFSYQTYIRPLKKDATLEEGEYHVYWKPIRANPIQSVQLVPSAQGDVTWEISTNMVDWHQLKGPSWSYDFNIEGKTYEKNQNQLYIRATIKTTSTRKPMTSGPEVTGLKVILKTHPAESAYLKTLFYNPRLGNLLSSSMWSRLGTDVTITPPQTDKVDVKVDVIQNKVMKDTISCDGRSMTFKLSEKPSQPLSKVTILPSTLYSPQNEIQTAPSGAKTTLDEKAQQTLNALRKALANLDEVYTRIKNESSKDTAYPHILTEVAAHFTNVNGIINELNGNSVGLDLLKRSLSLFETLDKCNTGECLLNSIIILRNVIINTEHFINNPNSNYIDVVPKIPGREGMNLELTENRDYTVNYEEGTLTLKDAWGIGELKVEYYPLWIRGLKLQDFPFRTDFIEETFTNTRKLVLRTTPIDPLRSVEVYDPLGDGWTELIEGRDYTVNYGAKTVEILKTVEDNVQFKVKYTPYLIDEGLALAYRMKRSDTGHQAVINSCYFQNRV